MRRAARKDETQAALVKDLRKLGFKVKVFNDTPDIAVRHEATGVVRLFEVDGITKNRKRDEDQLRFLADWKIPLVKTAEDVLAHFA